MASIFGIALLGRIAGFSLAWLIVFALGASTAGTYLLMSILTLWDRTKTLIFYSSLKTRILLLGFVYATLIAGLSFWIYQVGSVEALPIFPVFIAIFYAWVLLQSYFIATPISHLLVKIEKSVPSQNTSFARLLGIFSLFFPAAPLVYGVWAISSWLTATYQNVPGAGEKVVGWTVIVLVTLLLTYAMTVQWGWRALKNGLAERSIYAGGTFLVLWVYLLYRATSLAMGYITENQPSNAIMDSVLIAVSIVGAMQTFAKNTISRGSKQLNTILPFLVFTFGSIYAVAQFYFILEFTITRLELSMVINGIIFATGLFVMMFMIRNHIVPRPTVSSATVPVASTIQEGEVQSPNPTPSKPFFSRIVGRGKKRQLQDQTQDQEPSSDAQ